MDVIGLPGLGIVGALVVVVGYLLTANYRLLSANRDDRRVYLDALKSREDGHAAELAAVRAAHRADLASLRRRVAELETRLLAITQELDHERQRRRIAEDAAAAVRRTS